MASVRDWIYWLDVDLRLDDKYSVYVSNLFHFALRCSCFELSYDIAVCAAQYGFSMCEGPWKTYTYSIESFSTSTSLTHAFLYIVDINGSQQESQDSSFIVARILTYTICHPVRTEAGY